MVPPIGIEPIRSVRAGDFKSPVSAIFTIGADMLVRVSNIMNYSPAALGLNPIYTRLVELSLLHFLFRARSLMPQICTFCTYDLHMQD